MRIVVVGGGIGGLAAGLLLAPRGHAVTIVERDPMALPADPAAAWTRWRRAGVAQFRHIHLFNARGRNVLRDRAPGVLAALRAAGAGEIHLLGATDDEVVRLTCRRTTFEWVLRRALLEDGQVRVLGGTPVAGLLGDERRITGVRTADGRELAADLVVDAGGRRSRLGRWLVALCVRPPDHEEQPEGTVGYTRWYRLRTGNRAALARADLGYAAGVVAPADDGMFCVTFGTLGRDPALRALRHDAAFDAAAAAVPPIAAWTDRDRATVESGVLVMADRTNRLTLLTPPTAGVVALGDSAMTTNPGYGRGVGLALAHAACLTDVLDEVADGADAPLEVARRFAEATSRELEPWYHAAVAGDRIRQTIGRRLVAGEPWEDVGGPGDEAAVRFARGLPHAIERDPVVARAFHRTFQVLDPPSTFWGNPDITERVEAVWQTMDRCPPPRPGPDHAGMAGLIEAAVGR